MYFLRRIKKFVKDIVLLPNTWVSYRVRNAIALSINQFVKLLFISALIFFILWLLIHNSVTLIIGILIIFFGFLFLNNYYN